MRYLLFFASPIIDPLLAVFAFIGYAGLIGRRIMVSGGKRFPITRKAFRSLGYLPVPDHYYEPVQFGHDGGRMRRGVANKLFPIEQDFTYLAKIAIQEEFDYELTTGLLAHYEFRFGNGSFESGDAEILYYQIRHLRPKRIIEIGAGHSSKIISAALQRNLQDDCDCVCEHIIIEPFENPWLEKLPAKVIRKRVEEVDMAEFQSLRENDILFIDSSHVVRSQNDCVFEYVELLPRLAPGVVVHIHDIFTPYDYPDEWLNIRHYLWAEQYMVEAILTNSDSYTITIPAFYLSRDHKSFSVYCPHCDDSRDPGSLWLQKK